jgi:hypothetical protein
MIKIIKPHQVRTSDSVTITKSRERSETEIRDKRILIVKDWIAELMESKADERSHNGRTIEMWQKSRAVVEDEKYIAIEAITE